MIRNLGGPSDGPEKNRVMAANQLLPVIRQHFSVLQIIIATGEIELVVIEADAELRRHGVQNPKSLRDYFRANAVSGNDGDPMSSHAPQVIRSALLADGVK